MSVEAASTLARTVLRRSDRSKIALHRAAGAECFVSLQIRGSSTVRRITHANIAGKTPTRKSTRHPYGSRINADSPAASRAPIAHADCIIPTALARCSAGQLSATRTEPHDHSPPIQIGRAHV